MHPVRLALRGGGAADRLLCASKPSTVATVASCSRRSSCPFCSLRLWLPPCAISEWSAAAVSRTCSPPWIERQHFDCGARHGRCVPRASLPNMPPAVGCRCCRLPPSPATWVKVPPPDPLGTDLAAAVAAARRGDPRPLCAANRIADRRQRDARRPSRRRPSRQRAGFRCSVAWQFPTARSTSPSMQRRARSARASRLPRGRHLVGTRKRMPARSFQGPQPLADRRVRLVAGENRAGFRLSLVGRSPATLTARVDAASDATAENNEAALRIRGRCLPAALLVANRPALVEPLVRRYTVSTFGPMFSLPMPSRIAASFCETTTCWFYRTCRRFCYRSDK